MIGSPLSALRWGAAAGCAAGLASRLALKRALRSSNAVFFSVFAGGILFRLAALLAALWPLRHERCIIIAVFAAAMIAAQTSFELFPLKRNGTERNN